MIALFLKELCIKYPSGRLPSEFIILDEELYAKWKLLRELIIKDVFEYMVPFVVESGRNTFYECVNNTFSAFSNHTLMNERGYRIDINHKITALVKMHSIAPNLCSDCCCFCFPRTAYCLRNRIPALYIRKHNCNKAFTFGFLKHETGTFDKWYSKREFGNYNIEFDF